MANTDFEHISRDEKTFAPFVLANYKYKGKEEWSLQFNDWDWLHKHFKSDTVDGYYLNGYGVEGIVKAALCQAGYDAEEERINYNSEGDTCVVYVSEAALAQSVASIAAQALKEQDRLPALISLAREKGWED